MKHLFFALTLLATLPAAYAQQSGVQTHQTRKPLPEGTLFRLRAPEYSRWIITENPVKAEGENKTLPFSRRVAVTKSQSVIFEQIVDRQGRHEKWCIGKWQFAHNPQIKRFLLNTKDSFRGVPINPNLYTDYSVTDFPGFEWVDKSNFSDVRQVMNRECIVFEKPSSGDEEPATACVDLASRLPVVLKVGDKTVVYEFQRTTGQPLTPPQEIIKQVQELTAAEQAKQALQQQEATAP